MKIEKNIGIAAHTTMNVGGITRFFVIARDLADLKEAISWGQKGGYSIVIIGEGSNTIFSDRDFDGLVVRIKIEFININSETGDFVTIDVGAGVNWDMFVDYTVKQGFWGIENMSWIPGSVGATAVQNVGAFGQEVKHVIESLEVYDTQEHCVRRLENSDCKFSFRSSIFNTSKFGRYVILSIRFRLRLCASPNLSRKDLRAKLHGPPKGNSLGKSSIETQSRSQKEIRDAVISIRTNGIILPPDKEFGNTGTFFRAGVVPYSEFPELFIRILTGVSPLAALRVMAYFIRFRTPTGFKLPSKFLIEACGLKDQSVGNIRLFSKNCAVVINTGLGSASEIYTLSVLLKEQVLKKTGINMPIEPTFYNFSAEEMERLENPK